jgi:Kef-type K+ transport system membrane component KefB
LQRRKARIKLQIDKTAYLRFGGFFYCMETFEILLPLALILFLSKLLGLGAQKIGLPAVIGMLFAGIIISLIQYFPGVEEGSVVYEMFFSAEMREGYNFLAKIGVVLIMFSAGMGTDLNQIKATGKSAIVVTTLGVVLPMLLGFLVAFLFDMFTNIDLINGGNTGAAGEVNILSDVFYGAILTATSVSITVATLKELGKLNTSYGTAIIAAAVIDDIIGVVILSVLTGLKDAAGGTAGVFGTWFNPGPLLVCLKIVLFFVFAVGVGLLVRKLFKWLGEKYAHHRRNPIFAVALGFAYAYIAEKLFGVADITGAYIAGILLCGMEETDYEERKVDYLGYMLFTPIFFANIGISNINFGAFGGIWLAFGVCYVLAALAGKLFGCGLGGLICKYSLSDSTKIGLGMMVRAEVVLVCAQKGIDSGLVSGDVLTYVCLIIIISSFLSPLFLKMLCKRDDALAKTDVSAQVK